jgi:hypothetical protein
MSIYDVNIRKYMTAKTIAQRIEAAVGIQTPIRELVFKRSKQHPYPKIGIDQIKKVVGNVPVVRRGTPAVPIKKGSRAVDEIAPDGIDLQDFITAADLNNMRLLDSVNVQGVINGVLDDMLLMTKKTTEALCAQSLTGEIKYPMKSDDGDEPYEISYVGNASMPEYTGAVLSSSSTITDVIDVFDAMETLVQDEGWGGNVEVLAGKDVYNLVRKIVETKSTKQNHVSAKMEKGTIEIGGYLIRKVNASYKGYLAGGSIGTVKEIPEKSLCMVDLSAPHTLFYLALDDIDAGLQAMPFYAEPGEVKKNPSGIEIIGRSKPVPAPVVSAICWFKAAMA